MLRVTLFEQTVSVVILLSPFSSFTLKMAQNGTMYSTYIHIFLAYVLCISSMILPNCLVFYRIILKKKNV